MSARRNGWAVAAAAALALGTPGALEAAVLRSESDTSRQALVTAAPSEPIAGQTVRVTLLSPLAGRVRWLVDGRTLATRGSSALVRATRPGSLSVTVEERRAGRLVATGGLTLDVRAAPLTAAHRAPPKRGRARLAAASGVQPRQATARRAVHSAQSASVTIRDFQFSPASVTVHVGDAVSWVNNGPSTHTATATNGSFDTGALRAGQSGSHTFTQAGTYSYICSFHPFMHGTVVVTAAASAPSTSRGTTTSSQPGATTASAAAAPAAGSSLPMTGLDIAPIVAAGGLLLLSGGVLRRRVR